MTKLNNKGFAISTMLYGILTMVILVLTLLLSIMRGAYNKENAATEDITYYLNKCMAKQVALEECYRTYDDEPTNPKSCGDEYESYTSCLGKPVTNNTTNNTVTLYQLAIDINSSSSTGLTIDLDEENGIRYVYKGSNPNNYIKFGNRNGRIISIETNNTIKVIFDEDSYENAFDTTINTTAQNGKQAWENSQLIALLKSKLSGISYSGNLVQGKFYTGTIQTSNSTSEALATVKSEYSTGQVGLLSLEDYLKASSNNKTNGNCDLNNTESGSVTTALQNCSANNWLSKGTCYWTMTGIVSEGAIRQYLTIKSNGYSLTPTTTTCSSNIVVYFPSHTKAISSGNGSKDNPFVINLS